MTDNEIRERLNCFVMTGPELRAVREKLRLSAERFEIAIGITGSRGRTVYRWEAGAHPIPGPVATLAAGLTECPEFRVWFLARVSRG